MRQVKLKDAFVGDKQRLAYQDAELANTPIVPNPVEYEDIDKEMVDYLTKCIPLTDDDGRELPTYTFFSNQRFSEYSQTWEHTDDDGNLLMNFKTINRDNAPKWGNIHGGNYSIPGHNRFTVCMREIIDDTGVECYEVTSMSQPLQIDMKYMLSIITSKYELINEFNTKVNSLFSSRQCYIRPNGHYMPTTLESIDDNTEYTIDGRKFFIQTVAITVMGYIIPKDDIKVQLIPKRHKFSTNLTKLDRTYVSMDFDDEDDDTFKLKIDFKQGTTKVEFSVEDKMELTLSSQVNAKAISMTINDNEVDISGKILVEADDDIKISIKQPRQKQTSSVVFEGNIL